MPALEEGGRREMVLDFLSQQGGIAVAVTCVLGLAVTAGRAGPSLWNEVMLVKATEGQEVWVKLGQSWLNLFFTPIGEGGGEEAASMEEDADWEFPH